MKQFVAMWVGGATLHLKAKDLKSAVAECEQIMLEGAAPPDFLTESSVVRTWPRKFSEDLRSEIMEALGEVSAFEAFAIEHFDSCDPDYVESCFFAMDDVEFAAAAEEFSVDFESDLVARVSSALGKPWGMGVGADA